MPPIPPPFSNDIPGLRGADDFDPSQSQAPVEDQAKQPTYQPEQGGRSLDAELARSRITGSQLAGSGSSAAPSLQQIQDGTAKLQPGQQGPAVADIQRMLNMKPTGVYDAATQAAVKNFQEDHGLHSKTGEVGQQTLNALEHPHHPPAPSLKDIEDGSAKLQAGQQGPAVAHIQQMLHVPQTGIYDRTTQQAVKQFQAQHGLSSPSLEVGRQTLNAMEQAQRPSNPFQAEAHRQGPSERLRQGEPLPPWETGNRPKEHISEHHHPHSPADKSSIDARLHEFEKKAKDAMPHLPTMKDAENVYHAAVGKVQQFEKAATKALEDLPKTPQSATPAPPPRTGLPSMEDIRQGVHRMEQKVDETANKVHDTVRQGVRSVETKVYEEVDKLDKSLKKDLDS
jgi:peptidoglycan hydrolase-like protein with peptidoglycan-binding domain